MPGLLAMARVGMVGSVKPTTCRRSYAQEPPLQTAGRLVQVQREGVVEFVHG
jgi:hypothetical protein